MAKDAPAAIRVIAFPGAPNLPTFAAVTQGYFAEEGLSVELATTPSSVFQAQKIAAGEFEIAFTAFDNVVAYSEGQGAPDGGNPNNLRRRDGSRPADFPPGFYAPGK